MRLSVVIPTHNTCDLTLACLASLEGGGATEVVVVDDASDDGTVEAVRSQFPTVSVVEREERGGFTIAANQGMAFARGDLLLLLNSDTEVAEGALSRLANAFREDPTLGIGGGELVDPGGMPQWRGGADPTPLWMFALASGAARYLRRSRLYHRGRPPGRAVGPVDWVTGAALAVRQEAWRDIGPLDEQFELYCQDLDLCDRARVAGWKVAVVAGFEVEHRQGATVEGLPGASEGRRLDLLVLDLVRWARKQHGRNGARSARRALLVGCRTRLAARSVRRLLLKPSERAAFDRLTCQVRAAAEALRRTGPRGAGA